MNSFPSSFAPATTPWLCDAGLRHLLQAIRAAGGEARVVGGAVRDALLGRPVSEVDLAVNLPPDRVSTILTEAGLKVVPTGIAFGTVTAVADGKGYEITTLRHDLETDGRRAKVAFTDDWQADAARRDFTFNALYADSEGRIYDYLNGRADLAAGRVRFIGDAKQRIQEDVLRILRFFRFHAWFGRGEPDAEALAACRDMASLLPRLSAERVGNEMRKLLAAPDPVPAWRLMQETSVLAFILPEATRIERLKVLLEAGAKHGCALSPLARLAALLPETEESAATMESRLRLSKRETEKLRALARLPMTLRDRLDRLSFRRILYAEGVDIATEAALLHSADHPESDLGAAFEAARQWDNPRFPLQGGDLLKLGVPAGPRVGALLRAVEEGWIAQDFAPSRAACLDKAKQLL